MKKILALIWLLAGCGSATCQPYNPPIHVGGLGAPCEIIVCAEAYSVTRAMTFAYTGPLFQLSNGSSTLNIGQKNHKVDMSTWSAFCSGVASNCTYTKFYAQIHTTANDLIPFNPANRKVFTIEAATGLPIIFDTTSFGGESSGFQYTVGGPSDNPATGINSFGAAESVLLVGQSVPFGTCCGQFGTAHVWNDPACPPCTPGTDFMIIIGYGQAQPYACQTSVRSFCIGDDLEGGLAGDSADYSLPAINYVGTLTWDPSGAGTIKVNVNGVDVVNNSPPFCCTPLNAGQRIHFAGGGDLSGPAPVVAREMLITNSTLSHAQIAAINANVATFYPSLVFPTLPNRPVYAAGPGDVTSGAKYFVGLRAYSAAEAAAGTQKMIHVQNISTTHTCDLLVAANGGLGNTANCSTGGDNGLSALAFCGIYTGHAGNGINGGTNCQIDRFYDQTGNGFDFLASGPGRGRLLLYCLNFSPCYIIDPNSASPVFNQSPVWVSVPQPYTTSLVVQRNGATSTAQAVLSHDAGNTGVDGFFEFFSATPNQFKLETESSSTFPSFGAAAADSSFHAIQGIFNAASSSLFVDGVSTTGTVGSDAAGSTAPVTLRLGQDTGGALECNNCIYLEAGFWPLGFSGTQKTNMNANQHSYWGF